MKGRRRPDIKDWVEDKDRDLSEARAGNEGEGRRGKRYQLGPLGLWSVQSGNDCMLSKQLSHALDLLSACAFRPVLPPTRT
jgi:hypothetical protein